MRDESKTEKLNLSKVSALTVVAFSLINGLVMMRAQVPTGSMEGTIHPGDRLYVDKVSYRLGKVKRGDIVVFKRGDRHFVKRVIGLPGEEVKIEGGQVFVDGRPLDEPYLEGVKTEAPGTGLYHVPDKGYFVMGDNRGNSWDSRFWEEPFVKRRDIEGKALVKYRPLKDMSILK